VTATLDPVIEHVAETGSTNSDLLARVRAAAGAAGADFVPCLLVAERQTAGRGRQGRQWHATPGASLTFSLAWPLARTDLSGLSLAIGVALADALEATGRAQRIGLKWPNDLWLVDDWSEAERRRGRKLAGVLVETAPFRAGRIAVVGIGLNIRAQTVGDASSGVASLDEIDPQATTTSTLARVAPALLAALRRFDAQGLAPFAERFAARDLLHGLEVVGSDGDERVAGTAAGIGVHGALLLRTARGVRPVESGEWRLRLADRAGSTC
jgi:BirA family transcriptional regulator, biotin operon repressor / biotin---[acetyl-CoA-carboxylase] ligase